MKNIDNFWAGAGVSEILRSKVISHTHDAKNPALEFLGVYIFGFEYEYSSFRKVVETCPNFWKKVSTRKRG